MSSSIKITETAAVTALAVGDVITETDTPSGPFYVVTKINAKSVLVRDADDETAEPARIRTRSTDAVLRVTRTVERFALPENPRDDAAFLAARRAAKSEPITHAIVDGETVSLDRDVTDVETETAAERVRRTVVSLPPERVALVVEPTLIKLSETPETLDCVRCERTLPSSTFPTVKSGGETYRKTECRACRSARAAAGLRTDGAPVGTRKPRESRSDRVSAENAQTAALAATLDLDSIARSL